MQVNIFVVQFGSRENGYVRDIVSITLFYPYSNINFVTELRGSCSIHIKECWIFMIFLGIRIESTERKGAAISGACVPSEAQRTALETWRARVQSLGGPKLTPGAAPS